MPTWKRNLDQQTATSMNGIIFKLTEEDGEYKGVSLNPKDIPPDDLDDEILDKMIKEAEMWCRMELGKSNQ
jgi:hypothetical protein